MVSFEAGLHWTAGRSNLVRRALKKMHIAESSAGPFCTVILLGTKHTSVCCSQSIFFFKAVPQLYTLWLASFSCSFHWAGVGTCLEAVLPLVLCCRLYFILMAWVFGDILVHGWDWVVVRVMFGSLGLGWLGFFTWCMPTSAWLGFFTFPEQAQTECKGLCNG